MTRRCPGVAPLPQPTGGRPGVGAWCPDDNSGCDDPVYADRVVFAPTGSDQANAGTVCVVVGRCKVGDGWDLDSLPAWMLHTDDGRTLYAWIDEMRVVGRASHFPEPCDECSGARWPEEQHDEHCSLHGIAAERKNTVGARAFRIRTRPR